MLKHTIETATTAIVVASLMFGMLLTMPTIPELGDIESTTLQERQVFPADSGLLKQPERF